MTRETQRCSILRGLKEHRRPFPSTPRPAEGINASRVRPIRERDLCEEKVSAHVRHQIYPASESGSRRIFPEQWRAEVE
ncbi:hypothetical protein TNCT_496471 [Trichonephila clavata]|uniref:Uncharacterized protein n=1 Tax=Trichonephila clavata TaxID=2740835 RepID=A0A8X6FYF1_TRICU|nr:hypothetical protein TNCT_496471 [Trichonephila clavata]